MTTAICYTTDESHKCWWKKLDTKEHVLLKSVYTNFKERLNKSLLEVRTVTLGNKVSGGDFRRVSGGAIDILLVDPGGGYRVCLLTFSPLSAYILYFKIQRGFLLFFWYVCFPVVERKKTDIELNLSQSLSWELTQIPNRNRQQDSGELSQGTERNRVTADAYFRPISQVQPMKLWDKLKRTTHMLIFYMRIIELEHTWEIIKVQKKNL